MKKSIRQLLLTAASIALVSGPVALAPIAHAQEDAIAVIGDTTITKEDLYNEMKAQYGMNALRGKIIETVLRGAVKDADALKKSAEDEVKKQIEELGGEEVFNQFLAYQNLGTPEQYKHQLYIRNMMQEVVSADMDMSDEAIKAYYENGYQPNMEAQHILVKTEEEAKKAIERINNGEEFDAVAKEISQDPSGQNGGLLSPFQPGQMVPEFENAVKSLQNGEMTKEPVKSQFGYHIIKVINNGEKKPLEEIKDQVTEAYKQSKFADTNYTFAIIGKLIKEANVDIKDESLKAAVEDLIKMADQPQQPAQQAPATPAANESQAASEEAPAEEATTTVAQ